MATKKPYLARMLLSTLKMLKYGELIVTTPEGEVITFKAPESGPVANIRIKDYAMVRNLITRGDVGFAEDYIDGNWETDDLPTLLTMLTMNIVELDHFFHGHWWSRLFFAFKNFLRSNTKKGSKKNIRAHYDLGNDFYKIWLDKTMTYSSALYSGNDAIELEQAQKNKYERIIEKLGAKKGDHILEIGCGWGGFAEIAASKGIKVTGLTISQEQTNFALERIKKAGFSDLVDIKILDYRDAKGSYDHIVSIEMFEAVGERYWPYYFNAVKSLLKPNGNALIQTITIGNEFFDDYRKRSDFIQQYTFPGGALPSEIKFIEEASKAGLKVNETFAFGQDYVLTLKNWLTRVEKNVESIKQLGFKDDFLRSWRFYLAYCIAGFATQRTNVIQVEIKNA